MRVLIADDELDALVILRKTLELNGYDVTSFSNGQEAIDCLQDVDGPSLAIVDWMMDQPDGLEVIRQVRESTVDRAMYLILLTARSKIDEIVEGLDIGADDYITKPFARTELLARVHAGFRVLDLQEKLRLRVKELELAREEIRDLSGLITICAHCRKILDDDGAWINLEEYIGRHSDARFSHGICRDCSRDVYPEYFKEDIET